MLCHKTIKRSLRVPVEPFGPSTTRDLGSIDTEFGPKAMLAGFLSGMLEIFSEAIRKAPALEEVQLCAQQPPDLLMERGKAVLPEELADSPLVLRRIRRSPENVLPDLPHIEDLLDEAEKWTIRLFDLPCTELQQEIESSRAILAQLRVSVRGVPSESGDCSCDQNWSDFRHLFVPRRAASRLPNDKAQRLARLFVPVRWSDLLGILFYLNGRCPYYQSCCTSNFPET